MSAKGIHITDPYSIDEAHNHKDADEEMFEIKSTSELYDLFDRFLYNGLTMDFLDFHAHGSPGQVSFPEGTLETDKLDRFRRHNFHKLFAPKAQIRFYSCESGKGSKGERFLAEFASIFLQGGGGTVMGSDKALCYHVYQAYFHTSGPPTTEGNWITVEASPNSTIVQLRNNRWLDADRIRKSITGLTDVVHGLQGLLPGPRSYAPVESNGTTLTNQINGVVAKEREQKAAEDARLWTLYQSLERMLKIASDEVQMSRPSLDSLNKALDLVSSVSQKLVKIDVPVHAYPNIDFEDDKIILDQED